MDGPLDMLQQTRGWLRLPHFRGISSSETVLMQPNLKVADLPTLRSDFNRRGFYTKRVQNLFTANYSDLFEVEIEFEKYRRIHHPDSVSRFSCFWVAEASMAGRSHIEDMLGAQNGSFYIATFVIGAATNVTKADTRAIDSYWFTREPQLIEKYWSGAALYNDAANAKWEFLVEGDLYMIDHDDRKHLRID